MDYGTTTEGSEVNHSKYGRGTVVELSPLSMESMPSADVYFYKLDDVTNVPVAALRPVSKTASVDVQRGEYGFELQVDDGFFQIYVVPDGAGRGFDISIWAGNAKVDACHLTTEEFL